MTNMPSHFASYIVSHSKSSMKITINQLGGCCFNSFKYGDTDSLFIQKRHSYSLADNEFVSKSLGVRKNDSGNSGTLYSCFLDPKIKRCLVIDHSGVMFVERIFKGYNDEHRMTKPIEFISVWEGKTIR